MAAADVIDIEGISSDMYLSSSSVVIRGRSSFVIGVHNLLENDDSLPRTIENRLLPLTDQIVMMSVGYCFIGWHVYEEAKTECAICSLRGGQISVSYISSYVSGLLRNIDDSSYCKIIICGFDAEGSHIFKINKFGIESKMSASAIGYNECKAEQYLKAHYNPSNETNDVCLIKLNIASHLKIESDLEKCKFSFLTKGEFLRDLSGKEINQIKNAPEEVLKSQNILQYGLMAEANNLITNDVILQNEGIDRDKVRTVNNDNDIMENAGTTGDVIRTVPLNQFICMNNFARSNMLLDDLMSETSNLTNDDIIQNDGGNGDIGSTVTIPQFMGMEFQNGVMSKMFTVITNSDIKQNEDIYEDFVETILQNDVVAEVSNLATNNEIMQNESTARIVDRTVRVNHLVDMEDQDIVQDDVMAEISDPIINKDILQNESIARDVDRIVRLSHLVDMEYQSIVQDGVMTEISDPIINNDILQNEGILRDVIQTVRLYEFVEMDDLACENIGQDGLMTETSTIVTSDVTKQNEESDEDVVRTVTQYQFIDMQDQYILQNDLCSEVSNLINNDSIIQNADTAGDVVETVRLNQSTNDIKQSEGINGDVVLKTTPYKTMDIKEELQDLKPKNNEIMEDEGIREGLIEEALQAATEDDGVELKFGDTPMEKDANTFQE